MRPGWDGMRLQAAATLPRGWILEAPEHRAASARTMSAAFRLNLTVLSLGALAVGAGSNRQSWTTKSINRPAQCDTLRRGYFKIAATRSFLIIQSSGPDRALSPP